jgi:uncharacterized membrane protein
VSTNSRDLPPAAPDHAESFLGAWVHRVLFTGSVASATLLAVGGALVLAGHMHPPSSKPPQFAEIARQAVAGDGEAVIELGLLLLMLTPFARVVVLAAGWLFARDWAFAAVALLVLLLLAVSMTLGTG